MDLELKGKTAFVGGSSRGIGKAIAAVLLQEGCKVAISGRDKDSLEKTAAEFAASFGKDRIISICGNLADSSTAQKAIERVVAEFHGIDLLICNAGTGRVPGGSNPALTDFQAAFDVNVAPIVTLISACVPVMTAKKQGSVVCIGSIAGIEAMQAPPFAYSAAKAALSNYIKNMAREYGPYNVRFNCVAPGNIYFPGGGWEERLKKKEQEVKSYIEREVPLNRFGTPEDVAAVVAFLCSDRASFVTGACVVTDGGQTHSI